MRCLFLLLALAGCDRSAKNAPSPADASGPSKREEKVDPFCGMGPGDWCPAPAGDPCGAHKDVASCRADPRCKGMPYRGESVVACNDDGHGFSTNCPSVGCISR